MSKGQKPMVWARIDYSWRDQIAGICQETGKSESEVVREALAAYLGKVDVASITSITKRMTALERQLKKLTALVTS